MELLDSLKMYIQSYDDIKFNDEIWLNPEKNFFNVKLLDVVQKSSFKLGVTERNRNGVGNIISTFGRPHSDQCFRDLSWSFVWNNPSFVLNTWFSSDVALCWTKLGESVNLGTVYQLNDRRTPNMVSWLITSHIMSMHKWIKYYDRRLYKFFSYWKNKKEKI